MRVERNAEKDGIEIFFDDKPDETMRDRIKSNGFRFGKYKKCWYAKYTPMRWEFAVSLTGVTAPAPVTPAEEFYGDVRMPFLDGTRTQDMAHADNAIADKVDSAIAYLQQLLEEI